MKTKRTLQPRHNNQIHDRRDVASRMPAGSRFDKLFLHYAGWSPRTDNQHGRFVRLVKNNCLQKTGIKTYCYQVDRTKIWHSIAIFLQCNPGASQVLRILLQCPNLPHSWSNIPSGDFIHQRARNGLFGCCAHNCHANPFDRTTRRHFAFPHWTGNQERGKYRS